MQFLNTVQKVQFDWFDLVVLGAIVLGVIRGRKRGMTAELLPLLQWLLIIILGAYTYAYFGLFFNNVCGLGLTFSNIAMYLFLAMVLKWVFTALKNLLGDKLLVADAFGKSEYTLGMAAGVLRFFCMLVLAVAILHGFHASPPPKAAPPAGASAPVSAAFASLIRSLQERVFVRSVSGRFAKKYLANLLLKPASPPKPPPPKKRDADPDPILDPK
jgi:uncharacterized membrane protein required for colicin V production